MINLDAPYLTPASAAEELILSLFWSQGTKYRSYTVRELLEQSQAQGHSWTYNTVSTFMTRLEQKAYVRRVNVKSDLIRYESLLDYQAYRNKLLLHFNARYPK